MLRLLDNDVYREAAKKVMSVLPKADYELISDAKTAELIKYGGNVFLFLKVIYANMLYDLSRSLGVDYELVREAVGSDPRINHSHLNPMHKSGRGAGGHFFIKDFAAFKEIYEKMVDNDDGNKLLNALEGKNLSLLKGSCKDLDLLSQVYGDILNS